MEVFAQQITLNEQYATSDVTSRPFFITLCRIKHAALWLEHLRIVKSSHVNASLVWSFEMNKLHAFLFQCRLIAQVLKHSGVLHLRQTYECSTALDAVCTQARQDLAHIGKLMSVL